ncbi:hypothetical protein [Wolbachia endosymbiont of Brugia pahangi]|uniref:hypothetical protein n=1 Tax=Wolbachia endosymbiont of Brugia pahangi TaxID=96495 RepID=UPI001435EAE6|nr:hypothetical protein [Wolbachia endosymbiont of Brugia pahangi]QIT36246.1 hypothetical protein WBP_1007 [Wolbachia endosymbiont of Brugia pahangi]
MELVAVRKDNYSNLEIGGYMPNIKKTVSALISAFNVNNYARRIIDTNFSVQRRDKKDCVIVSFDKGMDDYQCRRYLSDIKRRIICEFYDIEKDNDKEILNTAELIFDIKSFPFDLSKGEWYLDEDNNRLEFVTPIDPGVIFNLKSHLAASLAKDVRVDMPASTMFIKAPNKEGYLWQGEFPNTKLCEEFVNLFLSGIEQRYENIPQKPLKVKDNDVYIKDIFNDIQFVDSITRYTAWLVGMYLGVSSSDNYKVKLFKDMIIESVYQSTGIIIAGFMCASPLGRKEASILIPVIRSCKGARLLTCKEALILNETFNGAVFDDISGDTQAALTINGSSWVCGINFSNPEISHCVINKIIENSVINEDHELAIPYKPLKRSFMIDDEAKEYILQRFIFSLPLDNNEKSKTEILGSLFSPKGREKLYSILSLSYERKKLYSEFYVSPEQSDQLELKWCSLHEQPLTHLKSPRYSPKEKELLHNTIDSGEGSDRSISAAEVNAGSGSPWELLSKIPGIKKLSPLLPRHTTTADTNSKISKAASQEERIRERHKSNISVISTDSAISCKSGSPQSTNKTGGTIDSGISSLRWSSVVDVVESSGEGKFPRGSFQYASSVSSLSTTSSDSVSSNISSKTIIPSKTIDVSRYNREHGPSVLYNEGEGIDKKKLGLELTFEPGKYHIPPSKGNNLPYHCKCTDTDLSSSNPSAPIKGSKDKRPSSHLDSISTSGAKAFFKNLF